MSERQVRSTGRSCDTVASFLIKTYEILEHPEYDHIISWEKDGIGFVVKDVTAFTKEILPKYFRHGNFSSFVRQLNMYDFHKVKQDNNNLVFKNPLFQRGEPGQLKEIKRKASKKVFSHRRLTNERNYSQNEKYFSTLKTLKKSMESEINHSAALLEKSLSIMKESSESNKLKIKSIEDLQNQNLYASLDALFILKEECFSYFSRLQNWLSDSLESQVKKEQMVATCVQQLKKNKDQFSRPEQTLTSTPCIAQSTLKSKSPQ